MRAAVALPVGVALALAPAVAHADPPSRVTMALDYSRGPGGEACPAEPTALRRAVVERMGYDPFDASAATARERLAVVLSRNEHGFAASVERVSATGKAAPPVTFPTDDARPRECQALISPLASYVRGVIIESETRGSARPVEPAEPPAAPELRAAPPSTAAQLAPAPEPAKLPEPQPNRARTTGSRIAIVSFAAAGVFTGLGIGWSVYAQNKLNAAQAQAAQIQRTAGPMACSGSGMSAANCGSLVSSWQSETDTTDLRNGWFAAAGVTAAIGTALTVWVLNQPATVNGQPQTQVLLRPGGLVFSGTF